MEKVTYKKRDRYGRIPHKGTAAPETQNAVPATAPKTQNAAHNKEERYSNLLETTLDTAAPGGATAAPPEMPEGERDAWEAQARAMFAAHVRTPSSRAIRNRARALWKKAQKGRPE